MDRNSYYVDYYKRNVGRIKERSRMNYYNTLKKKGIVPKKKIRNPLPKTILSNKKVILTFD
jgi:hypothetical protein